MALKVQQLTTRAYKAEAPPDRIAAFLLSIGYKATGTIKDSREYCRLMHQEKEIILYWDGDVIAPCGLPKGIEIFTTRELF